MPKDTESNEQINKIHYLEYKLMYMKKTALLLLYFMAFLPVAFFGQDPKAKALAYFAKYKSKNAVNELILRSLPNLNDAKKIFSAEEDAKQFMLLMEALEKKMKEQSASDDVSFAAVDINTFTIKDIKDGTTNYNHGLKDILNKFNPNVRFYTLKLLQEEGQESGMSFIYWMNVNNKWIFISKPQQAFKKK